MPPWLEKGAGWWRKGKNRRFRWLKKFMKAPTEVREENSFPYTCLRKRKSEEMVPSAVARSPQELLHQEGGLIFDSVYSGPVALTDGMEQKGEVWMEQAGSNKEPLAQRPLKSLGRQPEAPFSLGHSCHRSLPCCVAEGGVALQPVQLLTWSHLKLEWFC